MSKDAAHSRSDLMERAIRATWLAAEVPDEADGTFLKAPPGSTKCADSLLATTGIFMRSNESFLCVTLIQLASRTIFAFASRPRQWLDPMDGWMDVYKPPLNRHDNDSCC